MPISLTQSELKLSAGQTLSGVLSETRELKVRQGRVWITITGVTDDYWLKPGETISLPAHMQIVIEADQHAAELIWLPVGASADTRSNDTIREKLAAYLLRRA